MISRRAVPDVVNSTLSLGFEVSASDPNNVEKLKRDWTILYLNG